MKELENVWTCVECGYVGNAYLTAPNPFDSSDEIVGCPECKEVGTIARACQHEGCGDRASAGVTNWNGYRYAWLCSRHFSDWRLANDEVNE